MNATSPSKPVEVDIKRCLCQIDGVDFPIVGFGTYALTGDVCIEAIRQAAKIGYRMFDTATLYGNFDAIAQGLQGQDRSHFYITSKVWHDKQSPANLQRDFDLTLEQLQTDYLDAYLIHWPNSKIPIEKTLGAMEKLRQMKKIRHIGLSNITVNHLKRALEVGVPITWVQIEMHPHFYDPALLDFCSQHSIVVQAWRPLDHGRLQNDDLLAEIGIKYGKTASQIALRWIIQHGCIPLPKSKSENHMRENQDIQNFSLSTTEMDKLDQRARQGSRFRLTKEGGLDFSDEFDFTFEECWPK